MIHIVIILFYDFFVFFAGKKRNWTVMKTKRMLCNAGLLKI